MRSKFFSKKEYQELAELFGLGKIQKLEYFRQGYQTPKVAATTSAGKFIIAKHNLSSKRGIVADMKIVPRTALASEIALLNHLRSLPVPRYVASAHGRYLEDYQGYTVSVYQYIEGRTPARLTPKMVYQLGRFVGAFHRLGNSSKPMRGRRKFYDLTPRVMALMHRYAKTQTHPLLKKVVEEVRRGVERTRLPKGLPAGPVHVDIKPDNELFVGERLAGIIDFGNAYRDAFVFDIGKTIMWNCVRKGALDPKLVERFLEGYAKERRLSPAERKNLARAVLFAIYSHVFVDLYHVPLRYVPQSYTLFLVRKFLPIARRLEKEGLRTPASTTRP